MRWGAKKRGIHLTAVNPASTSHACPAYSFASRANRPTQQTFRCAACGATAHADVVGAGNIPAHRTDLELRARPDTDAIKTVLGRRHAAYLRSHTLPTVQPSAQTPATGPSGVGPHLAQPEKHQNVQQSLFFPC